MNVKLNKYFPGCDELSQMRSMLQDVNIVHDLGDVNKFACSQLEAVYDSVVFTTPSWVFGVYLEKVQSVMLDTIKVTACATIAGILDVSAQKRKHMDGMEEYVSTVGQMWSVCNDSIVSVKRLLMELYKSHNISERDVMQLRSYWNDILGDLKSIRGCLGIALEYVEQYM